MGKQKNRNFRTKNQQFKHIKKSAAVFDGEERKKYLQGLVGAKKRRKEEYIKMKNEREKQFLRDQKQKIREDRKKEIDKLQEIIERNEHLERREKVEKVTNSRNEEVKVTTTFFK